MTLEMYVEDRMFEAKQAAYEDGLERGSFQTKYETARNLLYKGMDFEFVHDVTGLSIEAIQEIAGEMSAGN